jgi:RNA polymerase sigma-70 factor (ECF subfamily)
MDVCQSVFHSFFVRVAAGQYDLKDPQQLVALLMKMARNKFLMQVRRHHADGRDVRRLEAASDNMPSVRDGAPGPVRHAVGRELLDKLLKRLDPPERELAQRRAQGQEWKDIARELGGSAQTHRMRLSRAVDRVAADLGLDDGVFGEDDT